MADWVPTTPLAGIQPIATTSTVQNHPFGTIVQARHATYGVGEFIYLKGVTSTVVGSVVEYSHITGATVLAAVGGSQPLPIAIAMSVNDASTDFGWYQIGGVATVKKTCSICLVAGAAVGVLTTGLIAGTGSAKEIQGAVVAATASAKAGVVTVLVTLQRPHLQGRVS
jgi:hypothetical protein